MILRRHIAEFFLSLMLVNVLWLGGCQTVGLQPAKPVVELQQIEVPSKVFSIAGEVLAFQAKGKAGETQEVPLSLKLLQAKVGGFEWASVYEVDEKGKVRSQRLKVDATSFIRIPATSGNRYFVYAELGELYRNSYELLCRLRGIRVRGDLIPRICTMILCTPNAFPSSELTVRLPELADQPGMPVLGDGPIGGIGGSGDLCEQCLDRNGQGEIFYPVEDCSQQVPVDPTHPPAGEDVVYVHTPYPFNGPSGNSQIYKMKSDGNNPINLSNNAYYDFSPDVRHNGQQIVFTTVRSGPDRLYIMDITGSNVVSVPNTQAADFPKWSREANPFIVFTYPAFSSTSAIYRIFPDGTGRTQVTFPGPNENDEIADVLDNKHIVFVRLDRANNFNRDLYVKYIWDNRPPVRLMNTPDRSETLPVISHDGQKLAFRVFLGAGQDDQVHVARLNGTSSITLLNTIDLNLPADINISGIDFSGDDTRLYISTQANDVAGNLINRKQEVFSVKLDGTDQRRLTINSDADNYPSAVRQ